MEIQWPLILFVAFCAASAGTFASQALLALKKEGAAIQLPALIISVALLAVGGVAVLFHLAQPLHIFNGFGNPTSGITQELVAIVALAIVMVVYFVMIRQHDGQVPAWVAVLAVVLSLGLDVVCAHSYMMASIPAWDSALQMLSVVGASCAVGPAVVAAIAGLRGEPVNFAALLAVAGTVMGLVTTVAYVIDLSSTGGSLVAMGTTYIDPTNPTAPMFDAEAVTLSLPEVMPAVVVSVIASAAAVVGAAIGKARGNWKVWGIVVALCAFVAACALRVAFYGLGATVYSFYGITG